MPLYEYRCDKCDYLVEVSHSMNEKYEDVCPDCKGQMDKVFHPVGTIFKGSGFYTTDYARKGNCEKKIPGATSVPTDKLANSCSAQKNGCCPGCTGN